MKKILLVLLLAVGCQKPRDEVIIKETDNIEWNGTLITCELSIKLRRDREFLYQMVQYSILNRPTWKVETFQNQDIGYKNFEPTRLKKMKMEAEIRDETNKIVASKVEVWGWEYSKDD